MRSSMFTSMLLVASVLSAQMWQAEAIDFLSIVPQLFKKFAASGNMNFLGYECSFTKTPTFHKFEVYFESTFTCPELSHLKGRGWTRSNSNAVNDAILDYIDKAVAAGDLTREETDAWKKTQ